MSTTSLSKTLDGILLSDYLDLLLGNNDCAPCKYYIADKIGALDSEELLIHIEYPSKDNQNEYPLVWWKKDWQSHMIRYERLKKKSDLERNTKFALDDVLDRVVRTLSAKLGGIEDKGALRLVARNFVQSGDDKLCRQMFGVSLEEFKEAEGKLNEYLNSLKRK